MTFFKNLIFTLLLSMAFACSKNASNSISRDDLDSLQLTYEQINAELDQTWTEMIMDDDGKLENMRRVLQEVSYSGGNYNRLKHDSISKGVDKLAEMRYDQESMADSDLITRYDSLTTATMNDLTVFTTGLPQFEQYPLMGQLLQEIFEADDRVLQYRIQYDRAAKWYNQFIEENDPYMARISSRENPVPKPLFELPE